MRLVRNNIKIDRRRISDSYVDNMVSYLQHVRGISETEARQFVLQTVDKHVKLPKIDIIHTNAPGNIERRVISFNDFLNKARTSVLTPSGSLYKPVTVIRSIVSNLIKKGLDFRKKVKKLKFKALAEERFEDAAKYDAEQNNIKVKLNAIPGGFGSPSNLFYDKGGYNSVTSSARMLISNSFTCCEQLLAGNLPLFNIEELFNLITICNNYGKSKEEIDSVMNRFNLKVVSVSDVSKFLYEQLSMYQNNIDFEKTGVINYLNNIPPHVLQFIYYHSNLKHLIIENDNVFRPIINKMFAFDYSVDLSSINPSDFYKCDSDIMAIVTTMISESLLNVNMGTIVDKEPQLARLCVAAHNHVAACLEEMDDIFQVFIYHDVNFQNVLHRRLMQRKAVVVSDTDSVIFTAKDWAEWYVGSVEKIVKESYDISALVTYWLTEANADTMAKYAIGVGALGDDIPTIRMKNEFLYPALLTYDTKKVYAGIIKVQEGVVMAEPEPDLKGAAIRGIDSSPIAREFNRNLLIEDVLKPTVEGNLDGDKLISKVSAFEKELWDSVSTGQLIHLPIASVNTEDGYDDPMRTKFFYAKAWNAIFGPKYGMLTPPDKLPLVKVKPPNELFFADLKLKDPALHDRFKEFIAESKKSPAAFFVDPLNGGVPPELHPLINTREIVYANIKPVYLTLESLGIPIGNSNRHQLLSDIYGFDYGN